VRLGSLELDVRDDDMTAARSELVRDLSAYPSCCSRDDAHSVFELVRFENRVDHLRADNRRASWR
jgi:hypothetical protein